MIIPKAIQNKMRTLAKLSAKANDTESEIKEWFEKQGYCTTSLDLLSLAPNKEDSPSIEIGRALKLSELNEGKDITDSFKAKFESGEYDDCLKPALSISSTTLPTFLKTKLKESGIYYLEQFHGGYSFIFRRTIELGQKGWAVLFNYLKKMNVAYGDVKAYYVDFSKCGDSGIRFEKFEPVPYLELLPLSDKYIRGLRKTKHSFGDNNKFDYYNRLEGLDGVTTTDILESSNGIGKKGISVIYDFFKSHNAVEGTAEDFVIKIPVCDSYKDFLR